MTSATERHEYNEGFFDYINAGSTASARRVCPLLVDWLTPKSLLDVGCGAGAWCRVWGESGVAEVVGADGDYVDRKRLLIDQSAFVAKDLSQAFDLGRQFDLVTSLEVAEHVATSSSGKFVDNLARHGKRILFSAAVPGQGGEFHVNEQPLEFWRALFSAKGYRCFDPLRPILAGSGGRTVEPWYRYNTLFYAADEVVGDLPVAIRETEVQAANAIAQRAPIPWRARNAVLRQLPPSAIDALAKLKHTLSRRLRPYQG